MSGIISVFEDICKKLHKINFAWKNMSGCYMKNINHLWLKEGII